MITERGIGRARAQRSGARNRNRCALDGVGRGWRAGVSRKDAKLAKGLTRGGGHGKTRMVTERGSVVLVLSEAVLVIVIDARDGLGRGGARGFNTKPRRARRFFWGGWRASGISRRRGGTEGLCGGGTTKLMNGTKWESGGIGGGTVSWKSRAGSFEACP